MSLAQTLIAFRNEPGVSFSDPRECASMEEALVHVTRQLGQTAALVLDGTFVPTRTTLPSLNPSEPSEIIGRVAQANLRQVDRAIAIAARTFESWKNVPQEERALCLIRMAAILRERKKEFIAWLILEVGKNWIEADADVAEAIDFLEYYARQSLLDAPLLTTVSQEKNLYRYLPIGPVLVVPPWNFPLAILVGMMSAAVVTGNTVVIKPSSQSPVVAVKWMEIVALSGVPPGVVNLVTGSGGLIGDQMVSDPRIRMVAFTGSKPVGLHIHECAARTVGGQRWIKRVIAEMGGKNAIIVDESADLEAAVEGVAASAFGYQGQKCSACSRTYIHPALYETFRERLVEKVRSFKIGPARVRDNYSGPVISSDARKSVMRYVNLGKREGRLLVGGASVKGSEGFFIQPTVFDQIPHHSRLLREEIFGPVLVLVKASFEDALAQANATDYGLTGAVYSRSPEHLEAARRTFFCGNLYLNRKCTGAMVGGHPFGGFNMSGTDSKAGGPDYLELFRQAQCISERM